MSAYSVARVDRARESDKSTGGIWGDVPESTPFKGSVLAALEVFIDDYHASCTIIIIACEPMMMII